VIGDEEVRERVRKQKIGERIDSDHHPVEMLIKEEKRRKKGSRGEGRTDR